MLVASLKKTISKVATRLLASEDARAEIGKQQAQNTQHILPLANTQSPYFQAAETTPVKTTTCERDDIIFITSRFRSGSTVLWNMFRQDPNHTAYYEPFNERKWFLQGKRGDNVDATHIGVDDYWSEFNNMEDLDQLYQDHWIRRKIHMDEKSWDPKMKEYICQLVERAKGRPILQFNRIDFRLPWIKQHFPNAKILHLYRHPRDQWLSFLTDKKVMNKDEVCNTYKDAFYLDVWCDDLSKHFPFLSKQNTPHPYQRFYYLWKLSFLYGQELADLSISFEELVSNKQQTSENIVNELSLQTNPTTMCQVVETPTLNKWKNYADEIWFKHIEDECEHNLSLFFSAQAKGTQRETNLQQDSR